MKKQRPVNLNLSTIKMHTAAKASILHRISGVIMVFAIGILLWTLSLSLSSAEGFAQVQSLLDGVLAKLVLIGIVSALIYHLLGGIRHILMDLGHFEELGSGNASAKLIIALWIVLTVLVGAKLW